MKWRKSLEVERSDEEPIILSSGKVTWNRKIPGNQRNISHRPVIHLKHSRSFQDKNPRERVIL
jgi:hypothetical protein